jgi:hypothetical protein
MRRDEVQSLFERAEKAIRESEGAKILARADVKKLEREHQQLTAKIEPMRERLRAIESKARSMGLGMSTYGDDEGKMRVHDWRMNPSPTRKKFSKLKDQWRIATIGNTADDVREQQRVLREVAKFADAIAD